jgi:hypothetical protein
MSARIISIVGRAIDVIVAGRLVSHLRFAAGICVLAAGLLMGSAGGAVAVADPDSSGSTAPGDGATNASGQASATASSPVGTVTDARRKMIQRVTSTLGSGRQPGQQPSTGAKSPKKEPGGTNTEDENKDSGLARFDLLLAVRTWSRRSPMCSRRLLMWSRQLLTSSRRSAVPMWSRRLRRHRAPVAGSPCVAPVTRVVVDSQSGRAGFASSRGSCTLTSVAGAVVPWRCGRPFLFLGHRGADVMGGLGGIDGAGRSATAGASVAWQSRLVLPLVRVSGVPVPGNTGTATLAGIAASIFGAMTEAGRASSMPGMAPPAPNGAIPMGVRSFLRHAVSDLPVAVSVAALAAVALPGVGGLVILTLAGVRIGYRQAKAGFVLRTAGIAGFAGPRPSGLSIGVIGCCPSAGLRVVRATVEA